MYCTGPDKIEKSSWSKFVLNHPDGNIFQTPEMYEVFSAVSGWAPVSLFAIEDKNIRGVITGIIQKEKSGVSGFFSSRCIVWGGPLVENDDKETAGALLREFVSVVRYRAIYIQFRNIFPVEHYNEIFVRNGFRFQDHLTIHIDLTMSFNDLKKKIHHSRLTNQGKSLRKGVQVRELNSWDEIAAGYSLVSQTYRRIRMPAPGPELFRALFQILEPLRMARHYGVYYEGKMIGYRLALIYRDTIYDFYAGYDEAYNNKYPNDAVLLHILAEGCRDSGLRIFDFGGAGQPGVPYGVRDYKMKFGGELLGFGRYLRINNRLLYFAGRIAFRFWRLMKH